MEIVKVHESRLLLIIGIICSLVFSIFPIAMLLDYSIYLLFLFPIWGGFLFLSIFMILSYFRREVLFYSDHFTYTPALGKKRTYTYYALTSIQLHRERCLLLTSDGQKPASFELNMRGSTEALQYLSGEWLIPVETKDTLLKLPDKFYRKPAAENEWISARWSKEKLAKEKKAVRILNICAAVLCIPVLFLPSKVYLSVYLLVLLFDYLMYLFFYPRMIAVGSRKECDDCHLPYPLVSTMIAMLFLANVSTFIHISDGVVLKHTLVLFLFLLIPYILILLVRKIKESVCRMLFVTVVLFIFSFLSVIPINYIATTTKPVHEAVVVEEKSTNSSGRGGTDYYFRFVFREEETKMEVSKNLYNNTETGDCVRVCIRNSIFGMEYYVVHE